MLAVGAATAEHVIISHLDGKLVHRIQVTDRQAFVST
jgi:hypothetical protein